MMTPDEIKDEIMGSVNQWNHIRYRITELEAMGDEKQAADWIDIQNDIANHITESVMRLIQTGEDAW